MYSITEGFSPILYCRPDAVTLRNPFDTMKEGFNDWGGRGYGDFVPGEVTKQSLPGMRLQ